MRKSTCLLLVLLLLTSCGVANKETSPSPQNMQSARTDNSTGNQEVRQLSEDTDEASQSNTETEPIQNDGYDNGLALTDHLEQLAQRVPGVNGAHCVVMGKVAVVGIDVEGSLGRSRVGNIKYSVAEAIRKDPRRINALVTADMDITNRLEEMGKHITKGQPVSGFASELADIIGRIMPQLPEDTKPQNQTTTQ